MLKSSDLVSLFLRDRCEEQPRRGRHNCQAGTERVLPNEKANTLKLSVAYLSNNFQQDVIEFFVLRGILKASLYIATPGIIL